MKSALNPLISGVGGPAEDCPTSHQARRPHPEPKTQDTSAILRARLENCHRTPVFDLLIMSTMILLAKPFVGSEVLQPSIKSSVGSYMNPRHMHVPLVSTT